MFMSAMRRGLFMSQMANGYKYTLSFCNKKETALSHFSLR